MHFHGWALSALCRAGYDDDPRVERGFRYLLAQPAGRRRLGLARRPHRLGRAPVESPRHRDGAAGVRLLADRAAPRARRAAPPSCWPRASCSPTATPIARRPPTGSRSASRASGPTCSTRSTASPRSGSGKENSGVRTAEAYVRGRQNPDGLWYPGAPTQARRRPPRAPPRPRWPRNGSPARWLTVRVLIVLRRVN